MRYTGEDKKYDRSSHAVGRMILLVITPILIFSIALLPSTLILSSYFYFLFPRIHIVLFVCILPIILVICLLIFILSAAFFTGYTIKLFKITYSEGEYGKSIKNKATFNFSLYYSLYRPTEKLLSFFHIPPIYAKYLSLIGAKIGKNVFFGGRNTISDPCVTEIGSNTLIGGGATIMGHLGEEKLIIRKVRIGKNCLVGAEALIMPGVIFEDNVVLGGKSLVTKNKVLEKGSMYGGVPAEKIDRN